MTGEMQTTLFSSFFRAVLFLWFSRKLYAKESRLSAWALSFLLIFFSNFTNLFGMTDSIPLSLIRQFTLIICSAGALYLFARIQFGYACFIATAYILALGIWFNILTSFTISCLFGVREADIILTEWWIQVLRFLFGGATLWFLQRWFLQMSPDTTMDFPRTFFSISPALVNFVIMIVFHHSLFYDGTLVITDHFTAFALVTVLLGFSSLAVLITTNRMLYYQHQQEELRLANHQIQAQYEQFERQRQLDEALRLLRHDMKNHLNTLNAMVRDGGPAQAYIRDLLEQTKAALDTIDTGNPTLNIILGQKSTLAQRYGIVLEAYVNFKQGDFISPMDICTLFGNCIDNSIEAIQRDNPNCKTITVQGGVMANCIVVKFTNAYRREIHFSGQIPLTVKKNGDHGFGLRSVEQVLNRYNGAMKVGADGELFTLTWMIPLP